jgi:hypothetical protein
MPGIVPAMMTAVSNRALSWKKDYESSAAFISEILAYCEEKHGRGSGDDSTEAVPAQIQLDSTSLLSLVRN